MLLTAPALHGQVTVAPNPVVPGDEVTITYDATGRVLAGESAVFLYLGWNNWAEVVTPSPAMTAAGTDVWTHTTTVPASAYQLDVVFNDGDGTWDNNGGRDWHFPASVDPGTIVPATYGPGASAVYTDEGAVAGVVFRVWAPAATAVSVRGEFNNWSATADPMVSEGTNDMWSTFVPEARIGDEYKYYITAPGTGGGHWRVDPWARDTDGSTGNGIVAHDGRAFTRTATDWQTPPQDQMVIYQLHVGKFSGNGDGIRRSPGTFRDVVDRHLDDLLALNVNMVKILPVSEWPLQSWGYNPVHLFAPETDYGTPDDLRYMVDTLQANGIGVIVDVVYNHMSSTDNNLWEFDGSANSWFPAEDCERDTPWGPRVTYKPQHPRDWIVENARYWIEEFHMDGLRVDATRYMRGFCNENGAGWTLMAELANAAREANPRAVIIAEDLPNDPAVTRPTSEGGAGYDAQWADLFKNAMRDAVDTVAAGGDPNVGSIANAVANTGFDQPNSRAVKYLESHDEIANGRTRVTSTIDPDDPFSDAAIDWNKLVNGVVLTSPGIPMFHAGSEFLHPLWLGDGYDNQLDWTLLDQYHTVRDYYATLIDLRLTRPSLFADAGVQIYHVNEGANVFAFQRFDFAGDVTVVVANMGTTDFTGYDLGMPQPGTWHELVNGNAEAFEGNGSLQNGTVTATLGNRDGLPATTTLALPSRSLLMLSQTPLVDPEPSGPGTGWFIQ